MEVVKESGDVKIFKKRSGRFCIKRQGKWVNGADKVKLLVDAGLVKAPVPKKEDPPPAEEPAAAEEAPAE